MTRSLALLLLATIGAADAPTQLRFVACPIYRDTGTRAKAGCWLVDDPATGLRYDVSSSPTKPDWNHAVLVEGRVGDGTGDLCGGAVLDPVRVAVLEQACTRFMLPPEDYPGRTFRLPPRNVRPLYEDRTPAARPWQPRTFSIPFDFGSSFVSYQLGDYYVDQTILYALDTMPRRIVITGHAQTAPMRVSGNDLAEAPALAEERAAKIRDALVLRGVPRDRIVLAALPDGDMDRGAFDGLAGPEQRRVDVRIEP